MKIEADTIWQVCVECSKRYFYDRRIKRCARCSRERKEINNPSMDDDFQ